MPDLTKEEVVEQAIRKIIDKLDKNDLQSRQEVYKSASTFMYKHYDNNLDAETAAEHKRKVEMIVQRLELDYASKEIVPPEEPRVELDIPITPSSSAESEVSKKGLMFLIIGNLAIWMLLIYLLTWINAYHPFF